MSGNELSGMVSGGAVALFCIALGIALLSGRGGKLIAGYNAMTKKERARYNQKALFRAIGVYMLGVGGAVAGGLLAAYRGRYGLATAIIVTMLLLTVAFLIYVNVSKRFRA